MLPLARLLVILGITLLVIGGLLFLAARFGPWTGRLPLGRLPGDFTFQRGGLTCFFPLATSILLSIILTVIVNIIARFLNR